MLYVSFLPPKGALWMQAFFSSIPGIASKSLVNTPRGSICPAALYLKVSSCTRTTAASEASHSFLLWGEDANTPLLCPGSLLSAAGLCPTSLPGTLASAPPGLQLSLSQSHFTSTTVSPGLPGAFLSPIARCSVHASLPTCRSPIPSTPGGRSPLYTPLPPTISSARSYQPATLRTRLGR